MLVDELITLGPREIAPVVRQLIPLGNFALEELARSFPGPLWRPSLLTDSRIPLAHEISASAAALASFESNAAPYVALLLRHPSAEVRYYAIIVAGAIESGNLVVPLARAGLDDDQSCRRAAIHLLSASQQHPEYPEALTFLRLCAAEDEPARTRRRAIAVLTQLRDAASASLFVELLGDHDKGVAATSRVGLRVLTAHDFGFRREPWVRWLAERGREIRVQWLIEGLADARANIRCLASRELWRLTRFLQPLPENAARAEYLQAKGHYERWWSNRRTWAKP